LLHIEYVATSITDSRLPPVRVAIEEIDDTAVPGDIPKCHANGTLGMGRRNYAFEAILSDPEWQVGVTLHLQREHLDRDLTGTGPPLTGIVEIEIWGASSVEKLPGGIQLLFSSTGGGQEGSGES